MDSRQIGEKINRVIETPPHTMTKSEAREVLIAVGVLDSDGKIKVEYEELFMTNQDSGYILKNENDVYYCGCNMFDKQLRKVKIYHNIRYAEEAIDNIKKRNPNHKDDVWRIIKVEIREV